MRLLAGSSSGHSSQNATMSDTAAALHGLTVLERGWLSSNNILIHAVSDEPGAWLVDTSHVNHAAQSVALVQHALAGAPLAGIVNTHLHSDHCGGNGALYRTFGVKAHVPASLLDAVQRWDALALSHDSTGQRCERFEAAGGLAPGQVLRAGQRDWQALAAPGHDPDSLVLFDTQFGVLISADALWGDGFGVVFPELLGESGFDETEATLDMIESLQPRVVIPGHGAPFSDVSAALARARSRLAHWRADPPRHARHSFKVMLKYHLMEEGQQRLDEVLAWATQAPWVVQMSQRSSATPSADTQRLCRILLEELRTKGQLRMEGDWVFDTG